MCEVPCGPIRVLFCLYSPFSTAVRGLKVMAWLSQAVQHCRRCGSPDCHSLGLDVDVDAVGALLCTPGVYGTELLKGLMCKQVRVW